MSIAVELAELAQVLGRFDYAYLTTVDAECRAHVVAVVPVVEGSGLRIDDVGRRSRANAATQSHVTLVWPPAQRSGHSLIVDATCTEAGAGPLRVVPTRAVLHRAAPPGPVVTDGCAADCIEVL